MGLEPAISGSGFLRRQLAEGARSFLARRGVYDLLGIFPRERAALNHPLRIPNYSFPYRSAEADRGKEGHEVTQEFPEKILAAAESGRKPALSDSTSPRRTEAGDASTLSFPASRPLPARRDGAAPSDPATPSTSPRPVFPTLADGREKSGPSVSSMPSIPSIPSISLRLPEVTQAGSTPSFSIPGSTTEAMRFALPAGNAPVSSSIRAKGWEDEARHEGTGSKPGSQSSESPVAFLARSPAPSSLSTPSASARSAGPQGQDPGPPGWRDSGLPASERAAAASKDNGNPSALPFPALRPLPAHPEPSLTSPLPPQTRKPEAASQPIVVLPASIPSSGRGATATSVFPAFWERSYLSRLHLRRAR